MFNFLKDKDRTPPALPEGTVRRRYVVSGRVQGVGFRYRARYAAGQLGLTGWVENEDDGTVTLEARPLCPDVRHDRRGRLYPDHRHPLPGCGARPLGQRFLGARILNV